MSDPAAVPASLPTTAAGVRVERVVTSGVFELDGGSWEVENNVWIVGDDHACVVIDCAHDAAAILAAVGARTVLALLCTHAHNDHVNAAPAVREATGAPTMLHPADRVLWDATLSFPPDLDLADGASIVVGDLSLSVLHTRGMRRGRVASLRRVSGCSLAATPSSTADRCHRPVVERLPDDHQLHPGRPVDPARHGCAHRSRRRDHDRGRAANFPTSPSQRPGKLAR